VGKIFFCTSTEFQHYTFYRHDSMRFDLVLGFRNRLYTALLPCNDFYHGLRTPREEIAFTARPKLQSQSQIFRYGGSIFCLPHRPNFSDIFDLCLHWVSVVRGENHCKAVVQYKWLRNPSTKSNLMLSCL
jgi:hypothetical protein